ncbi:cellulose binding domain-containing protein [Cellulomonas sp. NPDC057328]|uniref:cellulose binding domain-containing protein n=1 Tax=Cellulomonas sp. NPDC057328 TaxID=3346101 RepID=UPI00364591A3
MTARRLTTRTRALVAVLAAAVLTATSLTAAALNGTAMGLTAERCSATFRTHTWPGGFVTHVRVTTPTAQTGGWVVEWMDVVPGTAPVSGWNATVTATPVQGSTYSGSAYSARYHAWNGSVAAGGTLEFGFQGTSTAAPRDPMNVRLNGEVCTGYPVPTHGWGLPTSTPTPTPTPTRTWNPVPTPTGSGTATPAPTTTPGGTPGA